MLKRCYKEKAHNYDNYGGRGITVCDRWRESFSNFYADLGPRPSSRHSLHRKENDGNYDPDNCEWATPKKQARNRRKPTKRVARERSGQVAREHPVNFKDLAKEPPFGRWTVVRFHGSASDRSGGAIWWCRCSCGTERPVKAKSLQGGRSQSCGCLHSEIAAENARVNLASSRTKHGLSQTKEYAAWNQMIQRCHNESNPTYERYGAIGVTVCERWRESFLAFLEDMGPCPSTGHTLDRENPFANYEPGNCRWATDEQQRLNQRRTRRFLFDGQMLTIPELSAKTGIRPGTLRFRLVKMSWPVERAISTDPAEYHQRK